MADIQNICVFCGSSNRADARYFEAARGLATALAQAGLGLVYGGANVGLMGEIAGRALEAGVEVRGVIPRHLAEREVAHTGLTELFVVESMHERKAKMFELSDAFIALPGGLGTLEELFEIATWGQLGLHRKPLGLLDVGGYYAHLRAFLAHAVDQGLLAAPHHDLLLFETEPATMVARVQTHEAPLFEQLIGREQT